MDIKLVLYTCILKFNGKKDRQLLKYNLKPWFWA